jgi:hypothetical protein
LIDGTKKVRIRNLCPWPVSFKCINRLGDIEIPAYSINSLLDGEELLAQCYSNNILFVGEKGDGAHARIYIESDEIRKEVGFESEGNPQKILTEAEILKMFDLKRIGDIQKRIREKVVTLAEKHFLIETAKKNKINDYEKLTFISQYCEIPLSQQPNT